MPTSKNSTKKKYWFPRKTHGWGWGLPSAWQGWLIFLIYVIGMIALPFLTKVPSASYFATLIGLNVLLFGVCYWKSEPPKWQWGQKKD